MSNFWQVATSDGRIKLVGQDGVEVTACSSSPAGTKYLQFLPKKGALLRVTKVCLASWSALSESRELLQQVLLGNFLVTPYDMQLFMQEGDLQLWALSDGSLLESMPFADPVTSVAVMQDEPFVLLGCTSVNIPVVSLVDSSGSLAVGAAHVHTLELQPFQGLPSLHAVNEWLPPLAGLLHI